MRAQPLPREFLLVAACCRWPQSIDRNDAIRAAAGHIRDWNLMRRIARRQRVTGLVNDGLLQAGIAVPAEVMAKLRQSALAIARQNLKLADESVRVQEVFDRGSLPLLFFKGSTLGVLAYGNAAIKHAWDIDILVAPETIDAAHGLLSAAGYVRVQPAADFAKARFREWVRITRECVYWHREKNIFLELHWRLVDNPLLIPRIIVASPSRIVQLLPSGCVRTLADDELFSYLCAHGASHAWFRLKWVADAAAFLAGRNEAEIERLYRVSQVQGAGRGAGQALLLCERLLGTHLPRALSLELQRDCKTRRLVAIALDAMAGRGAVTEIDDRPLGDLAIRLSCFLLRDGWRYRWTQFCITAVAPNDLILLPLPRPLYFLYPAVRLPSWLLRVVLRSGRGPLKARMSKV